MDRFLLLAPALLLLFGISTSFVVFCGLTILGRSPRVAGVKHNQFFGEFCGRFIAWVLGPLERLLLGRVSPNAITALSLLLCILTGAAAALGHLPGAVWLFSSAGILDVLDGRLARLSGQQTAAGALFDSVSDRWGELFAFAGYAWYLHDSPWLFAVMGALAGSTMVSYTRARAEGLGVELAGGIMQRAERVVLVAAGTLIAAWYGANPGYRGARRPDRRRDAHDLRRRVERDRDRALGARVSLAVAARAESRDRRDAPAEPTPAAGVAPARPLGPALQHPN